MFIRDIMTKDVITIPSNTSLLKAKTIMTDKKIRRLPVVEQGKPVGIITKNRLGFYLNSHGTSSSQPEYEETRVGVIKEIMTTDLVIEEVVALAQEKRVGALLVVENNQLVGIITTNDFFYKIANPVLGISESGTRLEVIGQVELPMMEDVITIVNREGIRIINLHIINMPKSKEAKKDLVIHLDTTNVSKIEEALTAKGYQTIIRGSKAS